MASAESEVKETIGSLMEKSTPETMAGDGVVDNPPDTATDNTATSESPQSDNPESETGEQLGENVSTFTITIAGKKKKKKGGKAGSSSDGEEDSQEKSTVFFNISNTYTANVAGLVGGASASAPQSAPSVELTSSAAVNAVTQYLISKDPSRDASAGVYTGSVITRRTEDGSPSPYTARYTPDGKMEITGDFREGFKDALAIYKAADPNIQHLYVSGTPLNDTDGYAVIKMGVDGNVMPILTDRGILGSAQLLAEEGAKNNPDGSAADTHTYLEQVAGNPNLQEKLINEMVKVGLGEKEALKAMDDKALADKAFEHVMSSKPAAEAGPQSKEKAELGDTGHTDGKKVEAEAKTAQPYRPAAKKPVDSGLTAAAAATMPPTEETQAQQQQESKVRSPGAIPDPFRMPTLTH